MAYTVTFVQMTAREQLNPSPPVPGLLLESLAATSPLIPELLSRVGAAYDWNSARRSEAEWETWLAENPSRRYALFLLEGEPAGIVVYDPDPGNEVEIKSFGLLPELVGKGLGGFALTLAVEQAWNLQPGVTRVWLHTSSKDNPRALPNYHRRGFSTFATRHHDEP
jgi:RimJ/RimL family protein N-acetyltransferase